MILAGIFCLFSFGAGADNYGPRPYILLTRIQAYLYPEISRYVCQSQDESVKLRLEENLKSSGLLALSADDICAGDLCDGISLKESGLDRSIETVRSQQLEMYRRESPVQREQSCKKLIAMLEKVKASKNDKPEDILNRFWN